MVSIIKYEGPEGVCIWKHPASSITTGSLLIVKAPYDVIITQHYVPVARYTTGSTVTINAKELSKPYSDAEPIEGYETECNFYFINKAYTFELSWRTDEDYPCRPRGTSSCEIRAFGSVNLQITNSARFSHGVYKRELPLSSAEEIISAVRNTFMDYDCEYMAYLFSLIIGRETADMLSAEAGLEAHGDEFAIKLRKSINEAKVNTCSEFGLSIVEVTVEHIIAQADEELRDNKYCDGYSDILQRENRMIPAEVAKEVESIISREYPRGKYTHGMCHAIWLRKKQLYSEKGYKWNSPEDIHPLWTFD